MTENSPGIEALLIHEPFLRALSGAILRGDDRVDDVIQETWRTALVKRPRDPAATESWLAKIAGNLSRRLLRRDAARHRWENQERYRSLTPTPSEIAEREETRRRVLAAVMALEEPYRRVVLARFYEGLPPREVAKRFHVPVETIRTQTRRGLERLRNMLDEEWMGNRRARILALVPIADGSAAGAGISAAATAVAALVLISVAIVATTIYLTPEGEAPAVRPPTDPATVIELPGPEEETAPPERPHEWGDPRPLADLPVTPDRDLSKVAWSAFPGMVTVPAGEFRMGVDERWLKEVFLKDRRGVPPLLQGKKKDLWWGILLRETPEHSVETDAYAIDTYEVTNAQYLAFLDAACRKPVFTDPEMNDIHLMATALYGRDPTQWEMESIYWLNRQNLESIATQVLADNAALVQDALANFNNGLPAPAQRGSFDDLPEPFRIQAWLHFKLPEGTALITYTRLVPEHWPQAQPAPEEMNHAVRYVSGMDADAFAEWAGKHVPTEAEWEKAARGPKNTIYPWGDKWVADDPVQKNLLVWNGAASPPRSWLGDRPVAVNVCPEGQSGYGCFNMLGNVMEWTSSLPLRYPRSDAKFAHWGLKTARVLRGQSYGGGKAFGSKELEIRATARIIEGPDGPVDERNLYSVLGFRCAKYPVPARDILMHRLRALTRSGLLPPDLKFDDRRAFGLERVDYDPGGMDMAFVRGRSLAIGLAPADQDLGARNRDGFLVDPTLGLVYLSPDIELEVETTAGARQWVAGLEFGFVLAIRDGRLALLRPGQPGLSLFGYLPVEGAAPRIELVTHGEGVDSAVFGQEPGTVEISLNLGPAPGRPEEEQIRIPLNVHLPENAKEGWRGTPEGR